MGTKSKAIWFGRLAALVAAGALASCSSSGPELLREGARLIEAGNFSAAVRKLEAARDRLPQEAAVWNHLGVAYHGGGQAAEAVQAYTQALALDRNLAAARFNLGCLRLEQGQFTQAVGELTTFTGLQPKSLEGWLKLAAAQTGARSPEAAERSLQAALKLDPANADAWNRLGLLHWNRRRGRDAQTAFESALRHQPDFGPALLNLAVLHHAQPGDRTTAVAFYRRYLVLSPRQPDYAAVQATVRQLEAELTPTTKPVAVAPTPAGVAPTNVTATAKPPTKTEPAPKAAPAVTIVTPERKAPETKAIAVAAPKIEVVQLAPEAPIKVASTPPVPTKPKAPAPKPAAAVTPAPKPTPPAPATASRTREPERTTLLQRMNPIRWFAEDEPAAPAPARTAAREPERASEEPLGGTTARSQSRYAYERPAAPKSGNRADARRHFDRGAREQGEGRATQAITEYLAAVQADPAYFEAYYNLGLAATSAGHLPRALSAYERALSIKPTDPGTRFNFALALQKAGHARDAANELETLLAANAGEVRGHLALANLYANELAQPARARPHYLKVLEAQPRHPQAAAIQQWLNAHP